MSQNDQNPFNLSGMVVFLSTFFGSVAFMAYVAFFHPGVHYDTIRERGDEGVQLAMFDPATVDNPWAVSEDMIEFGGKRYATYCASCHGGGGMGDGPAAGGLNPRPRNLVEGDWQHGGDTIGLYQILVTGIEGTSMAGYGTTFSPAEIWAIVHYVQSITDNKKMTDPTKLEEFAKSL
jgi:mono/diheme cytochrome c family protein